MEKKVHVVDGLKSIVITNKRNYQNMCNSLNEMIKYTQENKMDKAEECKKKAIEFYQLLLSAFDSLEENLAEVDTEFEKEYRAASLSLNNSM